MESLTSVRTCNTKLVFFSDVHVICLVHQFYLSVCKNCIFTKCKIHIIFISYNSLTPISAKKKRLGKVIKRADGSTIVVVDGKILKTMKSSVRDSSQDIAKSDTKSASINISADELSPDELSLEDISPKCADKLVNSQQDMLNVNDSVEIKRTITVDHLNQSRSNTSSSMDYEKSTLPKATSHKLTKDDKNLYSTNISAIPLQNFNESKKTSSQIDRVGGSQSRSKDKSSSVYNRHGCHDELSQTFRSSKRTRSPKQLSPRSPHRYYTKVPKRSRSPLISRPSSPRHRKYDHQSQKSGLLKQNQPNSSINKKDNLELLFSQEANFGSKEEILNLIQKQAEEMLQAQNTDPIDAEKKMKLRVAMESILTKRGLIEKKAKESYSNSFEDESSDSSDGHESPVLEKLHKKYIKNSEADSEKKKKEATESESPCIDNISVASDAQEISDVSHSDMELSDEEPKKDNEDGKTPAFRKIMQSGSVVQTIKQPSPQRIHIKFGKDAEEEAFQQLASKLDELKNSADVQSLIEAIENKIKSLVTMNLEPSNLEKKIKRYQTLVAKVVIKAESIKEKEDENIVTYHRYTKAKEPETYEHPIVKGESSIKYPVQTNEERKSWLYTNQNIQFPNSLTEASPLIAPKTNITETPNTDPYEVIKENYISQRPGYHVCLLCMIESNNESQFLKHLNGKKHIEAVNSKIKQMNTPTNSKKYKKHPGLVIRCKLCDVTCVGQKKYNDHANHRSHQALVQAYVKIGRVVPEPEIIHDHENQLRVKIEEIQDSGTPAVGREYMSVKSVRDCDDNIIDVYYCSLCKCNCNSEVQVEKHVRSKKHYLIYVKATQPDVNIPVNVGEHKKRRETTKKMISTMKTIKQMEEAIENNKVMQSHVDNMHDISNVADISNYHDSRSAAATFQPEVSTMVPSSQGFQLGKLNPYFYLLLYYIYILCSKLSTYLYIPSI